MLFPGTIPAASKLPARRMIRGENIEKNSSTLGTLVTRPPAKPGRNCGRACFTVLCMERAARRAKLYRRPPVIAQGGFRVLDLDS